jgi:LPXTG-motif cell wall-anchored protein
MDHVFETMYHDPEFSGIAAFFTKRAYDDSALRKVLFQIENTAEGYADPEGWLEKSDIPEDADINSLQWMKDYLKYLKNKLRDIVSGIDGLVSITDLTPGTYVIRETQPLSGFLRSDEVIEIVVDDKYIDSKTLYHMVNIPNHYEFVKTDNKGNPLAGVKFTIEDAEGNVFRDLVSGEDGIVRVTDLTPGKYVIREIETLEGFTRTDEAIVVEINEHYIVPEEMYHLVNYPNIQTGVEISNPWMIGGAAALAVALIALGTVIFMKKKKAKSVKAGTANNGSADKTEE